jgi:hypothetical protein
MSLGFKRLNALSSQFAIIKLVTSANKIGLDTAYWQKS